MKINISDMFGSTADFAPDINTSEANKSDVDVKRIKELTLQKIHNKTADNPKKRRLKKPALAAILIAAALALCGSAYAFINWSGFALSEDLSESDKQSIEALASRTSSAAVDSEGNITYFDENGDVLMTLTPEEDEEYLRKLAEEREKAVQESTDKVDVGTFDVVPDGITELSTDAEGKFDAFMSDNGYCIILCPENAVGYELSKGDTVTINLKANETIAMQFGYILDKTADEGIIIHDTDTYSARIEIPEDGTYCFYLINCSSSVGEFTDGEVIIN